MWLFKNVELTEIPDGYVGFVYMITNLITGKKYVGKKNFYSTRRVKVKNRINKKKVKNESSWRKYNGSNAVLVSDVSAHGEDNFKREILHLCKSKAEMSLLEVTEQIERKVLYTSEYYNDFIGCRISRKHLMLSKKNSNT